jgi:hypothetical protein
MCALLSTKLIAQYVPIYTFSTRKVLNYLFTMRPEEVVVFTDYRNTLKYNGSTWDFSAAQIKDFLKKNGTLFVNTGDSLNTLQEDLLPELDHRGAETLWLITNQGGMLYSYSRGELRKISVISDSEIEPARREGLLLRMLEVLRNFSPRFVLPPSTITKLLGGGMMSFQLELDGVQEQINMEVNPNQLFLDFFDDDINRELRKKVLDAIEHDPELRRLVLGRTTAYPINILRATNYIDLCTTTKSAGIGNVYASLYGKRGVYERIFERPYRLIIGDSYNDLPAFDHPFDDYVRIIKIFVGNNDQLYEDIRRKDGDNVHTIYMRGEFVRGTAQIFNILTQEK